MRLFAVLPTLALAACAPTTAETAAVTERAALAEDKLATALAGLVPGTTSSCLPTLGRTQVQSQGYGRTILYKVSDRLVYRSDTSGGCERLARGDVLVTRQPTGRLCSGDIATTLDPIARFQTGSCSFGPFTEYRQPSGS